MHESFPSSLLYYFPFFEFVAKQGLSQCRHHTLITQQHLDNNEILANFMQPMGIKICKDRTLCAIYYLSCTNISMNICLQQQKQVIYTMVM